MSRTAPALALVALLVACGDVDATAPAASAPADRTSAAALSDAPANGVRTYDSPAELHQLAADGEWAGTAQCGASDVSIRARFDADWDGVTATLTLDKRQIVLRGELVGDELELHRVQHMPISDTPSAVAILGTDTIELDLQDGVLDCYAQLHPVDEDGPDPFVGDWAGSAECPDGDRELAMGIASRQGALVAQARLDDDRFEMVGNSRGDSLQLVAQADGPDVALEADLDEYGHLFEADVMIEGEACVAVLRRLTPAD